MAHKVLTSMRKIDKILNNGLFAGNFKIFEQVQTKCREFRYLISISDVSSTKYLPKGSGRSLSSQEDNKDSGGHGLVGDGGKIKFTNITWEDFTNTYLHQPTVKKITAYRMNFLRVEMLSSLSEYGGKILWFHIDNMEQKNGGSGNNKTRILVMVTTGTTGILGVYWWFYIKNNSKDFNWKGFLDNFFGQGAVENGEIERIVITKFVAALYDWIPLEILFCVCLYFKKSGIKIRPKALLLLQLSVVICSCWATVIALNKVSK